MMLAVTSRNWQYVRTADFLKVMFLRYYKTIGFGGVLLYQDACLLHSFLVTQMDLSSICES